jgi:membrane protease subunit HflC
MRQTIGPVFIVIALLLGALYASFYTVDQTEKAILVQLGEPAEKTIEPGLHLKIPIIQKIIFFDSRLLDCNPPGTELLSADKKNLIVESFAKWRIEDPLRFYQAMHNREDALLRLSDVLDSEIRLELGRHLMSDILSKPRGEIIEAVKKHMNEWALKSGMSVIDVRIKRIDLPSENQEAVYARMKAERNRIAVQYRAEGQESAIKIKAAADTERAILLAEAHRKAEVVRGLGDAEAARIYAEAFSQDKAFFNFLRTIEASRNALGEKTFLIMSPDNELLQFMTKSGAELDKEQ